MGKRRARAQQASLGKAKVANKWSAAWGKKSTRKPKAVSSPTTLCSAKRGADLITISLPNNASANQTRTGSKQYLAACPRE